MSNDTNPVDADQLKRNRRMVIINGSYGIVALLAVVFALVKTGERDQLEQRIGQLEQESGVAKTRAEHAEAEAMRQHGISEEQRKIAEKTVEMQRMAETQMAKLQAELEKCRKGKK